MLFRSLGFLLSVFLLFIAVSYAKDEKKSDGNVKDQKLEPGAKLKLKFRRATKRAEAKKHEEEDGKVEVLKEKEDVVKTTSEDDKVNDEASADTEEDEEIDPNAKIEVEELYMPKECVNKTKNGDLVVVHYTGRLGVEGEKFDTTIDPIKGYMPFEFLLGGGNVIKGFEDGVRGMCKGEKRRIVIPPSLGYGKKGAGEIPGKLNCKRYFYLVFLVLFW